jgi:Kdo2-lipid IVA lauroyltransferase/acyltransferase
MKNIQTFLNRIAIQFLLLISRLPLSVLYLLSDFIYIVFYRLIKYRIKVVRKNLKNSFPDKTHEERIQIEKKYYNYLCDLIVESIKGFTIGEKELKKRMTFNNLDLLDRLYKEQKSAIIIMGHCGNWEWVCRSGPLFMQNRLVGVYKPLTNKLFDKLMNKSRTAFGVEQIPMAQIARYVMVQKTPFLLILIADQSPSDKESSYWLEFLNQETAVLPGAEKLATKFNLPVYFTHVNSYKRGYYTCNTKLLVEESHGASDGLISTLHSKELEKNIINNPHNWLWSHRRWKLKRNN